MAGNSNIAWTNKTWNPVRGCERVSEGCRKCYAEILAARHSYPGGWGEGIAEWVTRPGGKKEARWTGVLRTVEDRLEAPLRWRKPARVFVNSMSDLFHKDVPEHFIDNVFAVMAQCPQHTFQILTKRPQRMWAYMAEKNRHYLVLHTISALGMMNCPWPLPNVWLGVSCEDQATMEERVPLLLKTPAAVRWISAEPLLGPISFEGCWVPYENPAIHINWLEKLDWVVIGGESGSGARPLELDWARSLIAQCQAVGAKVFVKQDNGSRPGMQGRFTAEEWALKEYPA
jgi:protein gp37